MGENPETVLADAGYANERDLQALESAGVDGYVALGRESKQKLAEVRSEPAWERMRQKLSTEQGRNQYSRAQMAVGSAQRLDQAGAWISTVQRLRGGERARGMGLGVSGIERKTDVGASDGMKGEKCVQNRSKRVE